METKDMYCYKMFAGQQWAAGKWQRRYIYWFCPAYLCVKKDGTPRKWITDEEGYRWTLDEK